MMAREARKLRINPGHHILRIKALVAARTTGVPSINEEGTRLPRYPIPATPGPRRFFRWLPEPLRAALYHDAHHRGKKKESSSKIKLRVPAAIIS